MKRTSRKATKLKRVQRTANVDATPERLAKGDYSEMVNPGEIDSNEQPIGLTRRFKSTHLDRLYRNGRLTWKQWYVGDWYRTLYQRCGFESSVVASYGERTSRGGPSYGLARTEAQVRARMQWRAARAKWPADMVGFMDRFLLRDDLPKYGGRAAMRSVERLAAALGRLVEAG